MILSFLKVNIHHVVIVKSKNHIPHYIFNLPEELRQKIFFCLTDVNAIKAGGIIFDLAYVQYHLEYRIVIILKVTHHLITSLIWDGCTNIEVP